MIVSKKIINAALALSLTALLCGCGRYEQLALYQPSISAQERTGLGNYRAENRYMSVEPAPGVHMQFAAEGGVTQAPRLQLTIYLDQGSSLRWTSDQASISDLQGERRYNVDLGKWRFFNVCDLVPQRTCSFPDAGLVDGPVETATFESDGDGKRRTVRIRLLAEPTIRIRGARRMDTTGITFGKERWLSVNVPLTISEPHEELRESILTLPPLEINQQAVAIPSIFIRQERQSVYSPLLFF
ncbi:hypothetical protein Herbaro_11330 [Herbaspirillum sp. WKF16]|uniref:hypothetical protein n=1 Tax=Herbaspirillum sp. WKF16 TaxID=3028312 RepID=UPI0023A9AEC3|nr:hypothetical protein [Herbaspirillum sp. WKF16]WDZ98351.1 hypothetical protein Herbaro_11330 [Herbaspirillum sp. WKF16]